MFEIFLTILWSKREADAASNYTLSPSKRR